MAEQYLASCSKLTCLLCKMSDFHFYSVRHPIATIFIALGTAKGKYRWFVMAHSQKSQTIRKRRCGGSIELQLDGYLKLSSGLALSRHSSALPLMTTTIKVAVVIAPAWPRSAPASSLCFFFFFFPKAKLRYCPGVVVSCFLRSHPRLAQIM